MNAQTSVIMIVQARIDSMDKYLRYSDAVRAAGLLERHGAVKLCGGPAFETLEGAFAEGEMMGVLEFPSATAAHAFWNSPEYRKIAELRADAGDFRIALWPKLPSAVRL
jgi:uncharacterized protein (DUF1330 family)